MAGSNAPLRGGKGSAWEGGVRTPAFLAGGLVPDGMRGTTLDGPVAIWDYYATFLSLAGVPDPTGDPNPLSPAPPDSFDLWPYWTGRERASPRQQEDLVLDHLMYSRNFSACVYGSTVQSLPCSGSGALRHGDLKLLVGEIGYADWYGHFSPNVSWDPKSTKKYACSVESPCLFNVSAAADMAETDDLSASRPADLARLLERFHAHDADWHPPSHAPADEVEAYCKVALQNGGFATPWRSAEP